MDLTLTLIMAGILGLIVGSFLNVVIVRLPRMLETKWRKACHEFLELSTNEPTSLFNLLRPRSQCPACHTPIKIIHNIPIISYLLLGGRCAHCQQKISLRYPIVEFMTGVLTIVVALQFAVTTTALAAALLTWILIVLFFIDLNTHYIPDEISLSALWLGLFLSLYTVFITPASAIMGAMMGYGILWVVASLFKFIRKKDGMGQGDFKMLGMLGAWIGPTSVINVLLIAVILGLSTAVLLLATKKITLQRPMPFGPCIAVGGWLSLMLGPFLIRWLVPYLAY